ncbi:MAG: capsid assembly protein [Plesiomonas sp.]
MPYSHLTNAVTSDANLSQTDLEMLAKPVAVRDGDDLIKISLPAEEEDESRISVNINTAGEDDGHEDEELNGKSGTDDSEESGIDGDAGESDVPEFHKVDPKSLEEASSVLAKATAGHMEIIAEAMEKGLTQEQVQAFQSEYDAGGLSDKSYEALEALGYTRAFVNSFMAGQQSVADNFVRELVGYCGGQSNFDKLSAYMSVNQPDAAKAFNAAVERNDVTTIKALLDSAKGSMRQSFGKQPKRNLAAAAKPANKAPAKEAPVEGFANRAEMVKAMSDKRYERDAAYRREVELRVFASAF